MFLAGLDAWAEGPVVLWARRALLVALWCVAPLVTLLPWQDFVRRDRLFVDAHAYWLTAHQGHLYTSAPGTLNAYLYSPAFAQVIRPLAELPFPWFAGVVVSVDLACTSWLLAPLGWRWAIPILMLLPQEFLLGNIFGVLAMSAVLAVSGRPGGWALGWLTKITSGALGFVWHGVRREWRELLVGVAWTGGISAASFLLWPGAWVAWFHFLMTSSAGGASLLVRTLVATALVVVGARRQWWWCLPVAFVISAPLVGAKNLTYLAGLARLRPEPRPGRADLDPTPHTWRRQTKTRWRTRSSHSDSHPTAAENLGPVRRGQG